METSARFGVPLLVPGQAAKESAHNEALSVLEVAIQPVVEGAPLAAPLGSPQVGQAWIVANSATGAFAGQDGAIALYTAGGWRFLAAFEGLRAYDRSSGLDRTFQGGSWSHGIANVASIKVGGQQVVGARQTAIPSPQGGATVDASARSAIDLIIAALVAHGLIASA